MQNPNDSITLVIKSQDQVLSRHEGVRRADAGFNGTRVIASLPYPQNEYAHWDIEEPAPTPYPQAWELSGKYTF